MTNQNTSPKDRRKVPSEGASSNASKSPKKSPMRRLVIAGLVAAVTFSVIAGGIFYLSKSGKIEKVRSHFSSSSSSRELGERSSSGKKGEFYNSGKSRATEKSGKTKLGIKGDQNADNDFQNDIDLYGDPDGYDEFIDPYTLDENSDPDLIDEPEDYWDPEDYADPDAAVPEKKNKKENDGTDYSLPQNTGDYDLTGYTIILDPGHGGRDTGCVFPFDNPKYNECDFNLRIAKKVEKELKARGATVYMLRTDNSWVSLYNRLAQTHLICLDIAEREGKLPFSKERANELRSLLQTSIDINEDTVASGGMGIMVGSGVGEDLNDLFEMEYKLDKVLFLSIHLNSSESRTLHGNSIFYVTDDSVIESERRQMRENSEFQRSDFPIREEYYGRHNEDNQLLACCLYDNIVGNIPEFETNAHPVNADNYAVLREHGLTGCLIETAFLSDDNDRAMLQQEDTLNTIASSVSDAVKMYFIQKGN